MSKGQPELEDEVPVEIIHFGFSSPCPVRVNSLGAATYLDGEFLPDDERSEYCAVDATWLIGMQRCCDIHLRWAFEHGGIVGSFEELLEEVFGQHGVFYLEQARKRAYLPWEERPRYTQDEAQSWVEGPPV